MYNRLAIPKLHRELGRLSKVNQLIIWHHHVRDHVENCQLTKVDAFWVNRGQVMDLEKWLKVHRYLSCAKPLLLADIKIV